VSVYPSTHASASRTAEKRSLADELWVRARAQLLRVQLLQTPNRRAVFVLQQLPGSLGDPSADGHSSLLTSLLTSLLFALFSVQRRGDGAHTVVSARVLHA
jgi:hypothetical protein